MKLTDEPIPIPSSGNLITNDDLAGRSPAVFNNATVLKKAFKVRISSSLYPSRLSPLAQPTLVSASFICTDLLIY